MLNGERLAGERHAPSFPHGVMQEGSSRACGGFGSGDCYLPGGAFGQRSSRTGRFFFCGPFRASFYSTIEEDNIYGGEFPCPEAIAQRVLLWPITARGLDDV